MFPILVFWHREAPVRPHATHHSAEGSDPKFARLALLVSTEVSNATVRVTFHRRARETGNMFWKWQAFGSGARILTFEHDERLIADLSFFFTLSAHIL